MFISEDIDQFKQIQQNFNDQKKHLIYIFEGSKNFIK